MQCKQIYYDRALAYITHLNDQPNIKIVTLLLAKALTSKLFYTSTQCIVPSNVKNMLYDRYKTDLNIYPTNEIYITNIYTGVRTINWQYFIDKTETS